MVETVRGNSVLYLEAGSNVAGKVREKNTLRPSPARVLVDIMAVKPNQELAFVSCFACCN